MTLEPLEEALWLRVKVGWMPSVLIGPALNMELKQQQQQQFDCLSPLLRPFLSRISF